MRKSAIFRLLLIFATMAIAPLASADDFGWVGYYVVYEPASNTHRLEFSTFYDDMSCYDVANPQHLLNCPFTYTLLGTADILPSLGYEDSGFDKGLEIGGHVHNNNRPLFQTAGNPYAFDLDGGTITSRSATSISGTTDGQQVFVIYSVPEEGGLMASEVTMSAPPGWFCADYCYTATSWLDIAQVAVGYFVEGQSATQFVQVPQAGADYQVINAGLGHSDPTGYTYASYLRPDARDLLYQIAAVYHKLTHRQLSVNDMSLPVGGLNDIDDNWDVPHLGHRTGKAADINQKDIGAVVTTCKQDKALLAAVTKIIGTDVPGWTKRYCETRGRKHINFLAPP